MVFVKVRETYDLHTVKNKMSVIGIHTPKPDIIKANFPGLLMQCKAYRPVSCNVKVACASVLPLDPQGVGLAEGDVAPEDVFNPILYKAITNFGMSQIEARIVYASQNAIVGTDVDGPSSKVDVDTFLSGEDDFPVYYGLLSNAHGWKHANPQAGLAMKGLKPLVFEYLANIADKGTTQSPGFPGADGAASQNFPVQYIRGKAKPLPFINCTSYSSQGAYNPMENSGAQTKVLPINQEIDVPWINCVVGAIIVPPSRLHELFYRMVVEWTIEFSMIRPISEITNWTGLGRMADITHFQNYSYEATKKVLGVDEEVMENDQCMVSTNADIEKVM